MFSGSAEGLPLWAAWRADEWLSPDDGYSSYVKSLYYFLKRYGVISSPIIELTNWPSYLAKLCFLNSLKGSMSYLNRWTTFNSTIVKGRNKTSFRVWTTQGIATCRRRWTSMDTSQLFKSRPQIKPNCWEVAKWNLLFEVRILFNCWFSDDYEVPCETKVFIWSLMYNLESCIIAYI